MTILFQERLKELLHYDPATGVFTWKVSSSRKIKIGDIAGSLNPNGYLYIGVNGKVYIAHRLSWVYIHGALPADQLDHIDGNRSNNRIENLREATKAQNMQNQRVAHISNKTTELLGACFHKASGKFQAQIRLSGKPRHLGFFPTAIEAHHAYLTAKRRVHDFCTI